MSSLETPNSPPPSLQNNKLNDLASLAHLSPHEILLRHQQQQLLLEKQQKHVWFVVLGLQYWLNQISC